MSNLRNGLVTRLCTWIALVMALGLPANAAMGQTLLNLNFGDGNKSGAAAVGAPGDAWNLVPAASTILLSHTNAYGFITPVVTADTHTALVWADGTSAPVSVTLSNLTNLDWNGSEDPMFNSLLGAPYTLVWDWNDETFEEVMIYSQPSITISNLPSGTYDLFVYGLGPWEYDDEGFRVRAGGLPVTEWKYTVHPWTIPPGWSEGAHYVSFVGIEVENGQPMNVELLGNANMAHLINGLQIIQAGSGVHATNLPPVIISPPSGSAVPVEVTLAVPGHPEAVIFYSLDGSLPGTNSMVYLAPIPVTNALTITALAVGEGFGNSIASIATYELPVAPAPALTPPSGHFAEPVMVSLSSSLTNGAHFISMDGSNWMAYSGPWLLGSNGMVQAFTQMAGYQDSPVAQVAYSFDLVVPPTFVEPNGGTFTQATAITLSNALEGVHLEYSLDEGSTWLPYSAPFQLDGISSGLGRILTRATKVGYAPKTDASIQFCFRCLAPSLSHPSGNYPEPFSLLVEPASITDLLEISFDGWNWQEVIGPVVIDRNTSVHARTRRPGYLPGGAAAFSAAQGFSPVQGRNLWSYHSAEPVGTSPSLALPVFDPSYDVWRREQDLEGHVGAGFQHAGELSDGVRSFRFPWDGPWRVTGTVQRAQGEIETVAQVRILLDSEPVLDWTPVPSNGNGELIDMEVQALANQILHFQSSSLGTPYGSLVEWNPQVAFDAVRYYTIQDADGDGLPDSLEVEIGTDPGLVDTDGDGVSDFEEHRIGRNPLQPGTIEDTDNQVRLVIFTRLEGLELD